MEDVTAELYDFQTLDAALAHLLPKGGSVIASLKGNDISGEWSTDSGTRGSLVASYTESSSPSAPTAEYTWNDFKNWAFTRIHLNRGQRRFYRGQRKAHRLQRTLHRRGRRDLRRYVEQDVPEFWYFAESLIGGTFDLGRPGDYGAIASLAQHHGYPTPLLDWTESPFIAAFFAFSDLSDQEGKPVRIFELERVPQTLLQAALDPEPKIAAVKLFIKANPRAFPQQSVHLFSNVADIEHFSKREEHRARHLPESTSPRASDTWR